MQGCFNLRASRLIACPVLLVLLCAACSLAQTGSQPQTITLLSTRLANNLYLIHPPLNSEDGNVVVLCVASGILLSDTGLSRAVPELQAVLRGLPCPNRRVKYVINTHWHLDHAGGNRAFATDGAVIISQDETRRIMSSSQELLGSTIGAYPEIARPTITFSDRLTLHLDETEVSAEHYPNGHTGGDVVVRFGGTNILHIGDIYYGAVFPWVDADHGGSISGLRKSVERLLRQPDSTVFVPGHGDPVTKAELGTMARMIDQSFQAVSQGISQGLSLQQIQQKGLPNEWKLWAWEGMSTSAWVETVYREIMH